MLGPRPENQTFNFSLVRTPLDLWNFLRIISGRWESPTWHSKKPYLIPVAQQVSEDSLISDFWLSIDLKRTPDFVKRIHAFKQKQIWDYKPSWVGNNDTWFSEENIWCWLVKSNQRMRPKWRRIDRFSRVYHSLYKSQSHNK